MNTTILNYPGFQTLPKGAKQMLLFSETHFFDPPAPHYAEENVAVEEARARGNTLFRVIPIHSIFPAPQRIEITLCA
ncbi:MAG TPA: hypothetical protein VH595_13305 [Verrucomicrobiae bacterium]|jgi:hypothetical protein|nr:hypothetical protein [Verrucomicrobiae bacterium]